MEEQNNRNLILAMVLSAVVMIVWFIFFPPPEAPVDQTTATTTAQDAGPAATPAATTGATTGTATGAVTAETQATADAPRLQIDTPELSGSISLMGARIDDLSLKTYRETLDPASPEVRLLSPVGQEHPYYALMGWAPGAGTAAADLPDASTLWTVENAGPLAPGKPVVLAWTNTKGLTFRREIAVDEKFLFTVTDTVTNAGTEAAAVYPYGVIARHGLPPMQSIFVVHEGMVRSADGKLEETRYKDIVKLDQVAAEQAAAELVSAESNGWIGFTDHYWMTVLVPEQGKPFTEVTKHVAGADIYQTEIRQPVQTLAPGAEITNRIQLFAGAKEWAAIRAYDNDGVIPGFIDSIDWGWFFFLTKPIFAVLHWLHGFIGNMGLSIIALTFFLKFLVLPLAYKSYVSMARMKELQPEMEALKERAGDDKQKLQKEMMQLYKEKKVNPAAGCLPILIQIPIFFSLYKVIFVTIELRHAPFFGWLKDLSAPDPSSLYNFFGLLPWDAPVQGSVLHLIFIGVLPILLGITMWLQQKLNPAPTDPVQASIFAWMPWVFMFMLGGFASGLVVYWITNNTITFIQQYLIMWSHGKRPDIFGNIRSAKAARVEAKAKATPANSPSPPTKKTGRK
ncbi:membrane protein insertase YidC [Tabrizicola sp.]|uniref:membrane protein insertase YidC n=1 Tax=Tabrizicola sp. TaxID=2005166 RepID=UPI002FDD3488